MFCVSRTSAQLIPVEIEIGNALAQNIQWYVADENNNYIFSIIPDENESQLITYREGIYFAQFETGRCSNATSPAIVKCADNGVLSEPVTIKGSGDGSFTSIQWFHNGELIAGHFLDSLVTDTVGRYSVVKTYTHCPSDTQHIDVVGLLCIDVVADTSNILIRIDGNTTICIDSFLQLGANADSVFFCSDTSSLLSSVQWVMGDSCLNISVPSDSVGVLDTICIIHCYNYGSDTLYDTTSLVVIVLPPPDTLVTMVLPNVADTICLTDLLQWPFGSTSVGICDSFENTSVNILSGDTCIEIIPDIGFVGMDTLCLVHCDSSLGVFIYDTTLVIIDITQSYDLALTKQLISGNGAPGTHVTFEITVYNQGTGQAFVDSITVVDYIPIGLVLDDPDWIPGMAGSTGQSASTIMSVVNGLLPPGGLSPGNQSIVEITLLVTDTTLPGAYVNQAEIVSAFNLFGMDITSMDLDSDYDMDNTNDAGGIPGGDSDDVIHGDGSGAIGSDNSDTDEDDSDPALLCFLPSPLIVGDGYVCPSGDLVEYKISPYNPNNTYTWSISGGGSFQGGNQGEEVSILWNSIAGVSNEIRVDVETDYSSCETHSFFNVLTVEDIPLTCNDDLNLSLGRDCEFQFTASMGLEGEPYGNEAYVVELRDESGNIIPNNILTGEHAGQQIQFEVHSACYDRSCWGTANVEDKYIPDLLCQTFEVNCDQSTIPTLDTNLIPFPLPDTAVVTIQGVNSYTVTGFDPCGDVDLTYYDEEIDMDCTAGTGYTGLTLRHWTATDGSGNSTSCTDSIWLRAATLSTLTLPVDRDNIESAALECNGDWDVGCDGLANTGDVGEGDGIPQPCELGDEISAQCDIWAEYVDTEFEICGYNTKKIFREWYILDKCTGEFINHTQVIIIMDTEAPIVNCPSSLTAGTGADDCGASWAVPAPDAYDECSGVGHWSVSAGSGNVVHLGGTNYVITGLPQGCTELTYTVYDGCGNSVDCVTEVCVEDNVAPVALCDQNTQVSLGSDGGARVYAETFDDGSHDNCGIASIEVRRTAPNGCTHTFYGPYVEFCCEDIANSPIEVEMRVTDYAGNSNTCWVNVFVEDKLPPDIVCPPDITVSCEFKFDLNDLSLAFGKVVSNIADLGDIYIDDEDYQRECLGQSYVGSIHVGQDGYADDNCDVTVSEVSNANLECGTGVITRIFTATDAGGRTASCIQRITIVDCDPFYISDTDSPCRDRGGVYSRQDDVEWPCDVTLTGCTGAGTDPAYTDRPIYEDDQCSLVADTFVDEVFTIVDDACFKILRHWSIIDWCQEDPNNPGLPLRWDYTQVIKVLDEEGPVVTASTPECDANATGCEGYTNLRPEVMDCTPFDHLDFWWRIDLYNDGVGSVAGGYDLEGTSSDPSGLYPYGTHRILWVIEDMCGNKTTTEYTFEVEDCKKPSPVCINGLSSVVMPSSGQIEVWAVDFDASSFDNCDTDLDFRIWYSYMDSTSYPDQSTDWTLPTSSSTGADVLNGLPTGAIFYCEGLGNGISRTFEVRIYVVDDYGNWDYCTTTITIDDNDDVCPDPNSISISGSHTNEDGEVIGDIVTRLIGSPIMEEITHNAYELDSDEGTYNVHVSDDGYNWDISAGIDERSDIAHYLNGVTAQDLSLIQRHVAGIEYLNSNYKLVAADANGDREINILDVLELRYLLLGINTSLSNNSSWKHIAEDYRFPGVTNTSLPADVYSHEHILLQEVTTNQGGKDFIGVKIGDVDGDAIPNRLLSGDSRSGLEEELVIEDRSFVVGEEVEVVVRSKDFREMTAYQYTFGFDAEVLEYVGIGTEGVLGLTGDNFGELYADRGMLPVLWYSSTGVTYDEDEVLYSLRFRSKRSGSLRQSLSIGSVITEALSFGEGGQRGIRLSYETGMGESLGDAFALFQNRPNPFKGATRIGYILPEDGQATMYLYNASGKELQKIPVDGRKGYNEYELHSKDLQAYKNSVIYYQLRVSGFESTKKMILIK